jgi:hypothetical protein
MAYLATRRGICRIPNGGILIDRRSRILLLRASQARLWIFCSPCLDYTLPELVTA